MMFQACRPEHHHEQFCKEPGQRCLMTQNDWDLKVSIKIQETQGLDLLQQLCNTKAQKVTRTLTTQTVLKRGTRYVVYYDDEKADICVRWNTRTATETMVTPDGMLEFMARHYNVAERKSFISCFTEYLVVAENRRRHVIRCHPNYQSKGNWYDWGMVRHSLKDADGVVERISVSPAKFCCWVQERNGDVNAIVQICSKRKIDHDGLNSQWEYPLVNVDVPGDHTFHVIKNADIHRQLELRECIKP